MGPATFAPGAFATANSVTSLKIYYSNNFTPGVLQVDGATITTTNDNTVYVADVSVTSFTNITWTHDGTNGCSVVGIEVNGKLLIDAVKDSQVWSDNVVSSNGIFSSRPATQLFDGTLINYVASASGAGTITWTSEVAFPAGSKVEVMGQTTGSTTNTATVNGGADQAVANGVVWTELTYTPGDESEFVITMKSDTGSANTNWTAIRINGVMLVDKGVREPWRH